jgi:hypothetical protein
MMAQENERAAIREKATYEKRQRQVAKSAEHLKGAGGKHLKPVGAIDARTFLRWEQQEPGCWGDDSFRDKYYKDNPDARIQND